MDRIKKLQKTFSIVLSSILLVTIVALMIYEKVHAVTKISSDTSTDFSDMLKMTEVLQNVSRAEV